MGTTLAPQVSRQSREAADAPTRAGDPYMNPYLAGIGLGLVLLASFVVMGRGLGASGAFKAVVAWAGMLLAPAQTGSSTWLAGYVGDGSASPLRNWLFFEVIGVFLGALLSGLLAGRVGRMIEKGPRASTRARLLAALGGGGLTAVGAGLGRGCTSGQALTGGALLNAGSWVFMLCVFGGAYALARLMRWQWR
jgi:hypothetical protein